ncbi:Serine/Threonine kinase domain protein (macronuclear) [Tetrahymena thermophila SB210]|uniref:Serine/Threonine kinase domain protein n=1 Tax=Tetrahymena thermophila (strain SB210) TaxID=312017 RepID=Q231Y5_TETTS|nr:Serine/Threonine kinase domain protein [Tetrahymena thermophila SB210]EAR91315.2 Serine/Threonine kinase domain protein [Tetrahymena thermophila SB210]|eukprot:XP_001011560.2 Serine/Threonine kinase domain protein [Tetrahymena thermophila SB210]
MENNLPNIEEIKIFLQDNNYQFQRFLGKGDYSVVVQAYSNEDQIEVAVKIFNDEDQDIEKEIQIFEKLQGENQIVQIISTIIDPDLNMYAIVTELYDCNLKTILQLNKLSFQQILALTEQLLKALLTFHQNGIIHSDVKPQNILFSRNKLTFALCDFGKSHSLKDPLLDHTNSSLQGNLIYMSPEVSNGDKPYTIKADVFSIGVVILQCMLGEQLKPEQIIFLKTSLLVDVIPSIQSHPNYDFIEKIVSYMVNFNKQERLEPLRLIQKLKSFQKVDVSCLSKLVLPKKEEFSQSKFKKSASQQQQTNYNSQTQKSSFQQCEHIQYQQVQQTPILYKNLSLQNLNLLNSVLPPNGKQYRVFKFQRITTLTPINQGFGQPNQFNGQMYQTPFGSSNPYQQQQYSKLPFSKFPRNQDY